MVKFVALYKKPEDPEAFDKWYFGEHMAICKRYPDVAHMHVERVTGTPRGESDYYLMFEVVYPDRDTMMRSLMSEPGMESAKNVRESGFGPLFSSFFTESVPTD